ncbi:MAG: ribbon-helix-helix domain-containing protein [Thiobacillaceae bacterium]
MGNIMLSEKLSISLPPDAVAFIESYRAAHAIKSRSQVVELALRKLREEELESAYREAAAQTDPLWEQTVADGLNDEAW